MIQNPNKLRLRVLKDSFQESKTFRADWKYVYANRESDTTSDIGSLRLARKPGSKSHETDHTLHFRS
eukprot:1720196-Amphidinium_carterae.2